MPYMIEGEVDVNETAPAFFTWFTGESRMLSKHSTLCIMGYCNVAGIVMVEVSYDQTTWFPWMVEPILASDIKEVKCENHSFPYSRVSAINMAPLGGALLVASIYGIGYRQ